jgi:arylsulfatase A-like enzyme/Flp pilus assembly protein TadD
MRTRIGLVILTLAVVQGCGRSNPPPSLHSGQFSGGNVLLVTIDTLRRDRVGAYGNPNGLTHTLDRLAAGGIRYTEAFSHAPMTLPAHTSILTGLTPPHHGVRNNSGFRLDEGVPTLATILKQKGYRTGAFVGAFVLDGRFGLNRGFDVYDDRLPHANAASFRFAERRASEVVKVAGDWILDGHEPSAISPDPVPWLAWVHLFDPHAPYDAPPEYRAGRAPYDAEVAYADSMLGTLLDRLAAAHALDRTLVVVTADHGESLGDHGETTHGLFAYNATILVPLIVAGASIQRAAVSDAPVAHVDIVPTIADLLGVAAPAGLDGQSLVQAPPADRAVYFEALDAFLTRGWAPLTGIVRSGAKYIDLPQPELYDLPTDPGEASNLVARDPRADLLRRLLVSTQASGERTASRARVDPDAAARLRSLGYVATTDATRVRPAADADPKQLVAVNERFNDALTSFNEGRAAEALAAFQSILQARPDFLTARTSAATVLLSTGRAREAVALLQAAPPGQSDSPELLGKLAAALRDTGDLRGAAAALERARAAAPHNLELTSDLAVIDAALRRTADARALFREVLAKDPGAVTTWYNLGLLELQTRQPAAAADAFRHTVAADPSYDEAWLALGAALVDSDRAAAIDAWQHAERLRPRDYDLLFNLGTVVAESDHPRDALPYLERFVREAPRDRYARDIPRIEATIKKIRP